MLKHRRISSLKLTELLDNNNAYKIIIPFLSISIYAVKSKHYVEMILLSISGLQSISPIFSCG